MRITHLIATNFFGGPERQIVEHCRALAAAGWQPVVASFREGRPSVEILDRAREAGLATFVLDTTGPFSPAAIGQLQRELADRQTDVLVTHGYKSDVVGHFAARRGGVKRVSCARGFTGENWKVRCYEWLGCRFSARADRIVAVSRATAELLVRRGVPRERIRVVYNAMHLTAAAGSGAGVGIDAPSERGGGEFVIASVGRLSPEKGQRFLIDALPEVRRSAPGARIVLFGEGVERDALAALAQRRGVADAVEFAGFRNDVVQRLRDCDLLVNPSLTEGLPNAILEAFFVGVPVVATAVGGVPELVVDGQTGWLCSAGDAAALAQAIQDALRAPDERERRAQAARTLVAERFAPAAQLAAWIDVYHEVAHAAAVPQPVAS